MKKTILVLFALIPIFLSAAEINFLMIPKIGKHKIQLDGVVTPEEWNKAAKITFSAPCGMLGANRKAPARETRLYFYCDNRFLYGAAVCKNENLAELLKDADSWFEQQVWFQPRVELFFGSEYGDSAQLIMSFLGKTYKNFSQPYFFKVKHGEDKQSYTMEFAIPLAVMVRSSISPHIVRAGIYRASVSAPIKANYYYSWQDLGLNGALQNPESWGALLLGDDVIEKSVREYEKGIAKSAEKKIISASQKHSLEQKLKDLLSKYGKKTFSSMEEFRFAMDDIQSFEKELDKAKEQFFRKQTLPDDFRLTAAPPKPDGMPDVWAPQILCGRDYWYTFGVSSSQTLKEMERCGLTEHPFFKDSMLFFAWVSVRFGDFVNPDKWTCKYLEKYSNPFFISSSRGITKEQYIKYPSLVRQNRNFLADLDEKSTLPEFLKKYPYNKRFAGFIAAEAYAGGFFMECLDHYRIPRPKTKKEGYDALKKTYVLETRDDRYDPPFRNIANLHKDFRKYAGNGTGTFFHHIIYSFGDVNSGQELGETMDSAATFMAFGRGASRQYAKPWNNYGVFYGNQRINGSAWLQCGANHTGTATDEISYMLTPETRYAAGHATIGLDCGTVPYLQKFWLSYPWLCGTTIQWSEHFNWESFCHYDSKTIDKEDRLAVCLRNLRLYYSPILDFRYDFYKRLVKKQDRGVSYTPVGLIFDRWHGYSPLYSGDSLFGNVISNEADRMMAAVDHTIFPRRKGTRIYTDAPFGDIFDVLTNDASDAVLASYPVLMPVGEVNMKEGFAGKLMSYVKNGGTLILTTGNLEGSLFPEKFLGCRILPGSKRKAASTFCKRSGKIINEDAPFAYSVVRPSTAQTLAISADTEQNPVLLCNSYGKGKVILAAAPYLKPEGANRKMLNLFSVLMTQINKETLPLEIVTNAHYQVNRNRNGWVVMLFNADGIPSTKATFNQDDPPKINVGAKHTVRIRLPENLGKVKCVNEWWSGKRFPVESGSVNGKKFTELCCEIAGGDTMILEFVMQ